MAVVGSFVVSCVLLFMLCRCVKDEPGPISIVPKANPDFQIWAFYDTSRARDLA